jgi:dienelactone hydrolase
MPTSAELAVADLERKLAQASADLARVKRTATVVGGFVVGGGVLWLAWRLFSQKEGATTDG